MGPKFRRYLQSEVLRMNASNVCVIVMVFLLILCYISINYFAPSFINEGIGYMKGNRARIIAVCKIQPLMSLFSIFAYLRLMSIFGDTQNEPTREMYRSYKRLPLTVNEDDDKVIGETSNSYQCYKPYRLFFSIIIIVWLLLSHLSLALYWSEESIIEIWIFNISLIALGIWNHIVVILLALAFASLFIAFLNIFSFGRNLIKIVYRCTFLKWLFAESRNQALFSIATGLLLSLVTFISSNMLIVEEQVFYIRNLPQEANGIRFALLSDIHAGAAVHEEHVAKIVDRVNSENVDAIFLVGDLVDSSRSKISHRLTPLKYLQSTFGSFYVTGNHEYYYGNAIEWIEQFKAFGIHVLDNRSLNVSGMCIAGVNDYSSGNSGIADHKFDANKALSDCNQSAPVIVLSHNPAAANAIAFNSKNLRVDLILSGHTHAGQFYTIAPFAYFVLPYFYGVYQLSSATKMFVSAGTLYQGPPMKMLAMSQIWIIKLLPLLST